MNIIVIQVIFVSLSLLLACAEIAALQLFNVRMPEFSMEKMQESALSFFSQVKSGLQNAKALAARL